MALHSPYALLLIQYNQFKPHSHNSKIKKKNDDCVIFFDLEVLLKWIWSHKVVPDFQLLEVFGQNWWSIASGMF